MNKKKLGVFIGTVAVIAALGGCSMLPFGQEGSADDRVYVEKVSLIMNQYTGTSNRYNGTVESQDTFEVRVDSSRKIDTIKVEVGDTIEEGQTLVTYDTDDLTMQIAQAELEIESINNDIESDTKQKDILTQAHATAPESEKLSYAAQIQNVENSIAQKQFDLQSKQLEIAKYNEQIKNSSVKSKVSGVVKEINENGIDMNGNSAPFMTILQDGEYRVKGSIDEQNIWMLSEGQAVVVRSRVDNSKTWNGTISLIDTENPSQGNNNGYYYSEDTVMASKYPFYIELESAEGLILGQHVYIELDQGQEEVKDGLWLYGFYIVQDEDTPYVWVANDKNRLEKRYVELGEYDEEMDEYEIVSGLTMQDYITWPMPGLYEGVTTVTDEAEVDYSSPLYNQEPEMDEFATEMIMEMDEFGTEMIMEMDEFGTEAMMEIETYDTEVLE